MNNVLWDILSIVILQHQPRSSKIKSNIFFTYDFLLMSSIPQNAHLNFPLCQRYIV